MDIWKFALKVKLLTLIKLLHLNELCPGIYRKEIKRECHHVVMYTFIKKKKKKYAHCIDKVWYAHC